MERKAGFCLGSSGKRMDQYMIKDHMLSHYRKLYSAKAAVDCSVPKSMCSNVRYTDQKRCEQLRKDTQSQSARSISQTSTRINSRTSCSSKNSRPSIQGVDGACRYLEPSVISSPRVSTSFHSKQTVYPSQTACAYQSPANHFRTSSEFSYRIPDPQRQQSGHSSTAVSQRRYKSFQDPTQKTYSGDILMKHAHCFTQEKPFTPRTLKSDHKSTLLKYRYYTPPRRKTEEERSVSSRITRQDTYHGSAQFKRDFSPQLGSPHPFSVEHEWSDEESDLTAHHSKANRFRDNDFHLSLSRVSPEGMRSPIMRKVSAEEEELMYLEFITDVTNEILAQGLYSDRVLKRVFERHIHMNKHRLDEDKMRHLLDSLQNDLQSPTAASITTLGIEESDVSFQLRDEGPVLEKFSNTRQELASVNTDDADFILYKVFNEDRDQTENVTPAVASTPVNGSLLESFSPADLEEDKQELVNVELNHNEGSEITLNDHQHLTWPEENPRNTDDNNQLLEEINELGKSMAESLNVSEAQREQQEVFEDEQTREDLSDEEF